MPIAVLITLLGLLAFQAVLILIHEAAHYLAARACGVQVLRFFIGRGPTLLSWQGRDTEFALRLFPLGGGVGFSSTQTPEAERAPHLDLARSMESRAPWQRALVMLAGPFSNFLFAFLLLWIFFLGHAQNGTTRAENPDGGWAATRAVATVGQETEYTLRGLASWVVRPGEGWASLPGGDVDLFAPLASLSPPQRLNSLLLDLLFLCASLSMLVGWLNLIPFPRSDGRLAAGLGLSQLRVLRLSSSARERLLNGVLALLMLVWGVDALFLWLA